MTTEILRPPETSPYRRVILEPGIHPTTPQGYQAVTDRYFAGDLTAHSWNPQVAQRMHEYQPPVVAVDGLTPDWQAMVGEIGLAAINRGVWQLLPNRPSAVNQAGEVLVVGGDLLRIPLHLESLQTEAARQVTVAISNYLSGIHPRPHRRRQRQNRGNHESIQF